MKEMQQWNSKFPIKDFKSKLYAETNKRKNCGESYKMYWGKRDVKPTAHTGQD
jgi:hypothetical protein